VRGSLLVLALLAAAFAPIPNAVVQGSRPAPYGYFIPSEEYSRLREHHAVAVWLDRPLTTEEFLELHREHLHPGREEEVIAFHRELGAPLPVGADARFPAGVPIWLPPRTRIANSCCVWVTSRVDGWISTQVAESHRIGEIVPKHAHPAADSGSIDVKIYAVPIRDMSDFTRAVSKSRTHWGHSSRSPDGEFAFSQWVGERSKVARIAVSLPLTDVDGVARLAEEPTVHYLDAYGRTTSRHDPPSSPVGLMLVSALGGALLAGFLFFCRPRRSTVSTPET
jgi:hypothetical protein